MTTSAPLAASVAPVVSLEPRTRHARAIRAIAQLPISMAHPSVAELLRVLAEYEAGAMVERAAAGMRR